MAKKRKKKKLQKKLYKFPEDYIYMYQNGSEPYMYWTALIVFHNQ